MSTTLTNGLKLPDKGSVDWYADMQSNYAILDGAVGTVAEHTTQIASKAPAVHTHTKADITDFPAYGTTAGTICEGNDSRLSDARTPVAHTHGKADITDLFNSANTWSADQTITSQFYIKSPTWEKGVEPSSATHRNIYFVDKNNAVVGTIRRRIANGGQSFQFFGSALVKNGQLDPTGDNVTWGFSQVFSSDGSTYFQFDGNIGNSIIPRSNNTFDLGSSTLKWKTLNGVNPGALSLPDISGADPIDFSQWDVSGAAWTNFYTPSENGWLRITINDRATNSIYVVNNNDISASAYGNGSQITGGTGRLVLLMPVSSGVRYQIIIKANSISDVGKAEFIPCNGNV